ncbi:pyridoxal phosphate-dependent aminotransferase [Streptomyces sp. NPDC005251]|uniref:pyridoxal phosphate-dependent aminotransferase n=1 Tax=unclassified Streptomyces TaxID=2593676 RepID=UPI00339E32C1
MPGLDPGPDERWLEVYRRAADPGDPRQLRDLFLGRVEAEVGRPGHREEAVARWRASAPRRDITVEEVLSSRATSTLVKELFNHYFRDDLYGDLRPSADIILSGGAVDEESWGLPRVLKDCLSYALLRDWYGYSDSCGRTSAREAVAGYETARLPPGVSYGPRNVALTMGATSAISGLADLVLRGATAPAICAIPNYPPLVESVARRGEIRLVPLPSTDGFASAQPLIDALRADTPLVLLQSAANPTGALLPESEITRLVEAASPSTIILLDECHEWLGETYPYSSARAARNVVRVSSLSKNWSAPGLKVGWLLADDAFIDEYYEYASTTSGSPPSVFYTLIEVLARMERWSHCGVEELGPAELAEFEPHYGIGIDALQRAFHSYRAERRARERSLLRQRDAFTASLAHSGIPVLPPRASINLAARFDGFADSYTCFRTLLRETGVSVFPGALTFCLAGPVVRFTTAQPWDQLTTALSRLTGREYQEAVL